MTHPRSASTPGNLDYLKELGPGFITGVSDDDPSGIATYSQAGAQFGTSMLWVALFSFPLMAAVQEICARIGRVTGQGLAGNMRRHFSPALVYCIVLLSLVANTINIAADISAMASALGLLAGKERHYLYPLLFGLVSIAAELLMPYRAYSAVLKWISLSIFSYVGIVFCVQIPWREVLLDVVLPKVALTSDYLMTLVAVLGTTISPYLFFWQSSLEIEEQRSTPGEKPLRFSPKQARRQFGRVRRDTYSGMAISNAVMFFIILTTAMTLHAHHIEHIETTTQAAEALRPIAGNFAYFLFGMGIIGTGLLAVPVLAGATGYAISEAFGWPTGLDRKPRQARGFYAVIAISTAIGCLLDFLDVNPIKALVWAALINGLVSVPVLAVLMRMARQPAVMGRFVIPRRIAIAGWSATALMTLAAMLLLASLRFPR